MKPEPIWDWLSSVQFLGRYRVEGESSKFRNSVGYIIPMNALKCNAMATDAIMAKHNKQAQLRHADPLVTLRHYQKSIPASIKAAATALEAELINTSTNLFRTGFERLEIGQEP